MHSPRDTKRRTAHLLLHCKHLAQLLRVRIAVRHVLFESRPAQARAVHSIAGVETFIPQLRDGHMNQKDKYRTRLGTGSGFTENPNNNGSNDWNHNENNEAGRYPRTAVRLDNVGLRVGTEGSGHPRNRRCACKKSIWDDSKTLTCLNSPIIVVSKQFIILRWSACSLLF